MQVKPVLLAAVLVVALAGLPFGVGVAVADDHTTEGETETEQNETAAPGEKLAGVIGVQEAEIDGEIDERAYGVKIAKAQTNESKADVVAEQLSDVEDRIEEHEERLAELEEARANGEISEGEYQAKVAVVEAEKKSAERLLNKSNETASELPEDVLAENGVNTDAITELKNRADELGGPETAEIAKSIAGPDVGNGISADEADDRRPDEDDRGEAENETDADDRDEQPDDVPGDAPANGSDEDAEDRDTPEDDAEGDVNASLDQAEQNVTEAKQEVERTAQQVDSSNEEAQEHLEESRAALAEAEAALEDAKDLRDENASEAVENAEEASDHAEEALRHADAALDASTTNTGGDAQSNEGR